jgi:hypothetical protein
LPLFFSFSITPHERLFSPGLFPVSALLKSRWLVSWFQASFSQKVRD